MLNRTKAFSLTVDTLLALTLVPGAPFGYAQGRPTATRMRIGKIEMDFFDGVVNGP